MDLLELCGQALAAVLLALTYFGKAASSVLPARNNGRESCARFSSHRAVADLDGWVAKITMINIDWMIGTLQRRWSAFICAVQRSVVAIQALLCGDGKKGPHCDVWHCDIMYPVAKGPV